MTNFSGKDFFVDPNITRAESLPSTAFVDPEFLQLELETIFNRTWLLVPQQGSSAQSLPLSVLLDKPGSRPSFSPLGKPLFLQRSSERGLSCFPNVCIHAWHPLVEEAAVGGSIVCPQHGREFDADGKFVSQKGFDKLAEFPRESDNLRRLQLESWGPLHFACLGLPQTPLNQILPNLKNSVRGTELDSFKHEPVTNEVREVDGNWKQHAWNYMDNFHIRFVHKGPEGLADAIDLASYSTELYQYSALQWAYARRPADGFSPEQVDHRLRDPNHPDRRVFAL